MKALTGSLVLVMSLVCAATVLAQALPTSQPNYLQIYREEVKVGRAADHEKVEAGWPAAYEKAKNPYTYIALTSMTGAGEAWFVSPFESHAAMADSMKREDEPTLAASLGRLQRADADVVSNVRSIWARGRKDLSYGAYPESAKQRFYEITIFRVRPGHEDGFDAAAKAYGAACTPDFFLFDRERRLFYRGQMDGSRPGNDVPVTGKDLRGALDAVLEGRPAPEVQRPSLGCNIKWKPGNEPVYFPR